MKLQVRPGHGLDDLLDLPWHLPLDRWEDARLVDRAPAAGSWAAGREDSSPPVPRRARTLAIGGTAVVLQELALEDAERATRVLRHLEEHGVAVAQPLGVVSGRGGVDGAELPAVLLTVPPRDGSTHRDVVAADDARDPEPVLDAAVTLLVQVHVAGVVLGDPSLSRLRFERDAGRLSAVLVDVGAAEQPDPLTAAQRRDDLDAAAAAIAAGLVAVGVRQADLVTGLHDLRTEVRGRYRELWGELTRDELIADDDRGRGVARLRRVNELGFDVGEIEVTGEGDGLRLGAAELEPGHHRRRLHRLTQLTVGENQARRLLADIDDYRARIELDAISEEEAEAMAAVRWYVEVFHPTVAAVPMALRRPGHSDAELFHEVLEHRYYLSERAGHDVGTRAAVDRYVSDVLAPRTRAPASQAG